MFLILLAITVIVGGPIFSRILGHGPNDLFPYAVEETLKPVGPWTRVPDVSSYTDLPPPADGPKALLPLGADGPLGRDELLRLLDGGRISLLVALGATLLAMGLGVLFGSIAAYFGGWTDAVVSRVTELTMAFPLLFFVILLSSTVGKRIDDVTLGFLPEGVITLILVIGLFTWFYPARIIRAEVLSLREREFVEAARSRGTSDWRILRSHILPYLVPPIIVYSTLLVATNILLEAGISFLGLGIQLPNASWGSLLSTSWGTIRSPQTYNPLTFSPWPTVFPSVAILLTVLALNLFGEGLRAAADPEGRRR